MSELSRLKWHCRRGMKELDILLINYLDNYYTTASPEEQAAFRALLDWQDPDLFACVVGRMTPPDELTQSLIKKLCESLPTPSV